MEDSEPHSIRVTTSGKTAPLAVEALSFLKSNPARPLILHTIPADPSSKPGLHPATLAAPRLVSLVEKVKREYIASIVPRGNTEKQGLWQYTESGLLGPVERERPGLEEVLGGRTKPKMTHRPYLQITLSTRPLGLESGRNVTCQTVFVPRRRGSRGKGKGKGDDGDDSGEGAGEGGKASGNASGDEGEGNDGDDVDDSDDAANVGQPVARGGKRKSDATLASSSKRVRK